MKIKPILPFNAVVPGSPYPKYFTPDDAFEPGSAAAKAALDLGRLSDKDAGMVREAQQSSDAPKGKTKAKGADLKAETKAKGAAPENKAGGAED